VSVGNVFGQAGPAIMDCFGQGNLPWMDRDGVLYHWMKIVGYDSWLGSLSKRL